MRQTFSLNLLKELHLSRYVYTNDEFEEIYSWFGGPEVKIFNFLGEEIGSATIVNSSTEQEYTVHDDILERDVQISIDSIVRDLYSNTNE